MDFSITDDDRLLQQSVREFVEQQAQWRVAARSRRTDELPAELDRRRARRRPARPQHPAGVRRARAVGGAEDARARDARARALGPGELHQRAHRHRLRRHRALRQSAQQKARYLPKMASGEWIGSFALTEPQCGLRRRRAADQAPSAAATATCSTGARPSSPTRPRRTTSSPSRAPTRESRRSSSMPTRAGVQIGQVFDTTGHRGSQHLGGRLRGLPAFPPRPWSARKGRGSTTPSAACRRAARRSARAASARRRRRWSWRSSTPSSAAPSASRSPSTRRSRSAWRR